jgi:hypothetical protein
MGKKLEKTPNLKKPFLATPIFSRWRHLELSIRPLAPSACKMNAKLIESAFEIF